MASVSHTAATGLRENGMDSIRHAMDHFSERRQNHSDGMHHDKWIVLSVYHAAECICNALLLEIEPNSPVFKRGGDEWFPSLTASIDRLTLPTNQAQLTAAEGSLLSLFGQLPDLRHKFMHRVIPAQVDVSTAAMCLIGILKHLEARHGTDSSEIVSQWPPIETDIVEAIRYQRLDEYSKFAEAFLREKYKDTNRQLQHCPSCAVRSVHYRRCESCFEELDSVTCSVCEEDILFLPWERQTGRTTVECDCGNTMPI